MFHISAIVVIGHTGSPIVALTLIISVISVVCVVLAMATLNLISQLFKNFSLKHCAWIKKIVCSFVCVSVFNIHKHVR